MSLPELFLIAVSLSMDAFAIAICIGLSMPEFSLKKALVAGLYFGISQAVMPLAGYLLGFGFANAISAYDHWIAFALLAFIGGKMIRDSFSEECRSIDDDSLKASKMLPLAVATSIDALAVGVSFAFLKVSIGPAVLFIGCVTLLLSAAGVKTGHAFGLRFRSKAEFAGGAILVLMGLKILLEHTGVISF